jgi:hypothetical protein
VLADPAGQAQVEQHRSAADLDHVGRFHVDVHPAATVQVTEYRAQLDAQHRGVDRPQPAELLDQEAQRVAGQRFRDHRRANRLLGLHDLVAAHQVRVRELGQQHAFVAQPPDRAFVRGAFRPDGLGDAAAGTLLAPHVVDVEPITAAQVVDDPVTGRERITFRQR